MPLEEFGDRPAAGLHLSASHAGDVVLVAASAAGRVGVDVEQVASVQFDGFDDLVLTPAERRHLSTLPGPSRALERAVAWTRKEALLKATGHALTVDAAAVGFHPDGRVESAPAGLLVDAAHAGTRAVPQLPAGHVGTLALLDAPAPAPVRCRCGGCADRGVREARGVAVRRRRRGGGRSRRRPRPPADDPRQRVAGTVPGSPSAAAARAGTACSTA